jgi:hypothetical protein
MYHACVRRCSLCVWKYRWPEFLIRSIAMETNCAIRYIDLAILSDTFGCAERGRRRSIWKDDEKRPASLAV